MFHPFRIFRALLGLAVLLFWAANVWTAGAADPIKLHPDNPHYFLFRGRPTILLTSGEHYGAVLNRDFDYVPYLDELQARGFNLTRTFSGVYREVPGSFGIVDNTLAPGPRRYVCPWARSSTSGAADGTNKFDLKSWDPDYFDRLKDFVAQAGKRGIVVELSLFCTVYDDKLWNVNPMNAANNVNGAGKVARDQVYALKDEALTAAQDALVRKIAAELKDCDNVYYEVCNEPYFGGVTKEWNDHIIATLTAAEASFPARHLIAQNIANGAAKVDGPNKAVSLFNFHYAAPPDTVGLNYALRKAIGDDETGFRGKENLPYRTEAWDFLLAGGAVYSNLDYSFTCAHPRGTAKVTTSPGGGGKELRGQLQILKKFIEGFDFVKMAPSPAAIKEGSITVPLAGTPAEAKATTRVLAEAGRAYAIYVKGGSEARLGIDLPAGFYRAEWVNTKTGNIDKAEDFDHGGGVKSLGSPAYAEDIALRVKRKAQRR
jgi:hypothetical protein